MEIRRGAEAIVTLDKIVIKQRIAKKYRLQIIDDTIRKERVRAEARIMAEARKFGIPTPIIFDVEDYTIKMQYIDGIILKNIINEDLSLKLGETIGLMHSHGIIHGDLTTSNMIYFKDKIYLIDFGLAYRSSSIESQGVDLHVLFQTYVSTHNGHQKLIENFKVGYQKIYTNATAVINRIKEIEKRGRYA